MRSINIRKTPWLFVARTLALGFLVLHAMLYLDGTVRLLPATIMFFSAVFMAFFLERARLRFPVAATLSAGMFLIGRGLVFLVFRLLQAKAAGPEADFLFFRFDSSFLPMIAPVGIAWTFTFLSCRYRTFVPWECGLTTALFAALFWSQGGFEISLYPHPGFLALAAFLFLLLQVAILIETVPPGQKGGVSRRGSYQALTWAVIPLILLFLLFMYNWYSREAVSHGGGLIKPTFFRFDFSRYIRLESEISLDDDLVMLVRKEGDGHSELLRRFVLAGYRKGEGFFFEAEPGSGGFRTVVPDSPISLHDPGYRGREEVIQEYYIVNFDPTSLISINYPVKIAPLINWDESSFLKIYRVESRVPGFLPFELSECPDPQSIMDTELYEYYTGYGDDSAIRELTLEVIADSDSYYERVVAIQSFLLNNYYYSLKPGVSPEGNQLHHFLFTSGKGYCSYFAFAMALMARSAGIPARVAVGFFIDPNSEIFNYYPVRADMAHAWVEVFFPEYGWIDFDPTSTVIAPGEEYQFESMDMQEVSSLIEEILKNRYQLREEEGITEEETAGRVTWLRRTVAGLRKIASLWFVVIPGFYLLICFLFRLTYTLNVLLARDETRRVKRLYKLVVFLLRSLGIGRRTNETVVEYALRVDARYGTALEPLSDMYLKVIFSKDFTPEDMSLSMAYFRRMKGSIRTSFPIYRRVLGFLNPFGFHGIGR